MNLNLKASPHLLQIQIHLVVFILKDPQVADLLRQLVGGLLRIPGTHPQQHEKSLADLAPDLSVDGDGGMVNAGDDSAHRRYSSLQVLRIPEPSFG